MTIIARATLLAASAAALSAQPAVAADPAHPTVVEEYQSQGCSSCPPANANIAAIADRPDILALTFSVTYWDNEGWKDTFDKPAFTDRQWAYAHAGGRAQVFTPQVIVNGRKVLVGGNRAQLEQTIRAADRGQSGPSIAAAHGAVTIGAGRTAAPATVWLVRYDPRTLDVRITGGENAGRTLPHRQIVRSIERVGTWTGRPLTVPVAPARDHAWKTAVLVQQGSGGPILAAARV